MPTVTLSELQADVYDELDNNQSFYPQGQVINSLNEILYRLNLLIGWMQDTLPVITFTVPNQLIYPVPTGIIIPFRVYCEGRELQKMSFRELGDHYRNWTTDTTANMGPVARWVPIGVDQFLIHPMDALGGRLLEVQGMTGMTALVGPDDVVSLDDHWQDIPVDYAKMRVLMKLGGKTFADASTIYQGMIAKLKTFTIWADLKWPKYWILKSVEPAEGKGT